MGVLESNDVERTLNKADIHLQWEKGFRSAANERYYEETFDYIANVLNAPNDSTILDVGCGPCFHSIRLAKRGFSVVAADFSKSALKMAERNLQASGLQDRIKLQAENILSLSFPDETFDYILCWGVLMHIPDVEKAMSELSRILKKGGTLVVSEVNMCSLESVIMRYIKLLLRKEKANVKNTPSGLEYWIETSNGKLLTRKANFRWLKSKFGSSGLEVKQHVSGQFTELYARFSSRLALMLIHGLNRLWFRYIKVPYLANGNIMILRKKI